MTKPDLQTNAMVTLCCSQCLTMVANASHHFEYAANVLGDEATFHQKMVRRKLEEARLALLEMTQHSSSGEISNGNLVTKS